MNILYSIADSYCQAVSDSNGWIAGLSGGLFGFIAGINPWFWSLVILYFIFLGTYYRNYVIRQRSKKDAGQNM